MLVLLKPWELFIICLVNNIPSQYVPFQFPSQVHVALPFTSTLHVPLFSQGLLTHGETERKEINVWTKGYIVKLRRQILIEDIRGFFPKEFLQLTGIFGQIFVQTSNWRAKKCSCPILFGKFGSASDFFRVLWLVYVLLVWVFALFLLISPLS